MKIDPELIWKFFEYRCDPSEWEAIMHYLSQHPGAMEKFFPAAEWDEIKAAMPLPEDVQAEMLNEIREKIFFAQKRSARLFPMVGKRIAAAAAILISIACTALMMHRKEKNIVLAGSFITSGPVAVKPARVHRVNNTNKSMTIRLPDGSIVRLQAHSSVRYNAAYGMKTRDIYLQGTAFFDVVKDTGRPFTVFAGPLLTTVLGTTFRINAWGKNTQVKLFTGKVVVKPVDSRKGWKREIYLSPGEELSYNRMAAAPTVARPRAPQTKAPEEQEFTFNNASLKEVMDKLSHIYHYRIVYDYRHITGMNFTGTISRSDSLIVVLKLIAAMNDLEVQEQGNSYIVSRSTH